MNISRKVVLAALVGLMGSTAAQAQKVELTFGGYLAGSLRDFAYSCPPHRNPQLRSAGSAPSATYRHR